MEDRFQCNLCGHPHAKKIPFRYEFKGRLIYAYKCRNCNLIVLHPQPTNVEIEEMYSDDYFEIKDQKTHHAKISYLEATHGKDITPAIEWIKTIVPTGIFLEVGCATGYLLEQLKKNAGFEVYGMELSKFAADFGRSNYGLDIINKPFTDDIIESDFRPDFFDGILMGDVLEHFTEPKQAMELACKLLKKEGKLIVHVPGTLNLLSSKLAFFVYRITGRAKTMYVPPYHLTEFSPSTLTRMFLEAGFDKIEIRQKTKHPKSIPLRHSRLENFVKLTLQYPNYWITKTFGIWGDRITGIGTK